MKNSDHNTVDVSIVLPALNEEIGLSKLLPRLKELMPEAELIVIDDGSIDNTEELCRKYKVIVHKHPYRMGNGASVKHGARVARGKVIIFMDADGQHDPEDIAVLLNKLEQGYDMVVGARSAGTHTSFMTRAGNTFFNRFASLMTGKKILDLTSGFRAVRADNFRKFLYLLPNGFSYPTTSTMAFFRAGYPVGYVPIHARKRHHSTSSNIKIVSDGVRFAIIILKIGVLFSPMRLFLPVSMALFLTGIGYYAYTYFMYHRFTNMSALLFISSLMIFLIGILSEQVSSLHYMESSKLDRSDN